MKPISSLASVLGIAFVLGAPGAAFAQTDFLTAKKLTCTPDRMARCDEAGKCEFRDAGERDKKQPLVIDFETKKANIRDGEKEKPFGVVLEDKVEGETRKLAIGQSEKAERAEALEFTLEKTGKMTGTREKGRIKMEVTCTAS